MSLCVLEVIFHLLLESVLPVFNHYLAIYTFFNFAVPISALRYKKNLYLIHDSHSPFHRKNVLYSLSCSVQPLSHLTSCTPSNFYFDITFATVTSESALYRLLTFHVPNLIPIFLSLGRLCQKSVQVRGSLWHLLIRLSFTVMSC
jgi:hypothetical protein